MKKINVKNMKLYNIPMISFIVQNIYGDVQVGRRSTAGRPNVARGPPVTHHCTRAGV